MVKICIVLAVIALCSVQSLSSRTRLLLDDVRLAYDATSLLSGSVGSLQFEMDVLKTTVTSHTQPDLAEIQRILTVIGIDEILLENLDAMIVDTLAHTSSWLNSTSALLQNFVNFLLNMTDDFYHNLNNLKSDKIVFDTHVYTIDQAFGVDKTEIQTNFNYIIGNITELIEGMSGPQVELVRVTLADTSDDLARSKGYIDHFKQVQTNSSITLRAALDVIILQLPSF